MPTNKNIDLKIHEIPSKDIWDYMVENNLVNEDEFYLLHDERLSDVEEHTHEISDVNGLSTSLDNKLNKTGDAKDNTVTFTQSSTRTNISTGEKLSVLFGKIKKYFADLKTVAFTGSYNDLSDKPAIPTVTNDLTNALKSNYDTAYTHSQSAHAPSNAQKNVQSDWNATSGDALILNKPTIPSEVTESTVSGWGFTKNSGTYSKPSGGIPKTDLASAVQTSLGKADTALQSFTETDPTVPAWAKEANKPTYTASEVGAVPTTRTVNSKTLSSNITLTASDVGARPSTWTPTASDVGAVPTTRTVNGKSLSSNIVLKTSDIENNSGYLTQSDKLQAGTGIDITDGVISLSLPLAEGASF